MKYIFRGIIVFEYNPDSKFDKITQGKTSTGIPAFNFCHFINEDYKLISEFFDKAYRHTQGELVDLSNIEVY